MLNRYRNYDLYERLRDEIAIGKYDGYFSIRCPNPEHEDRSPSCLVYETGFVCKSCGFRGRLEFLDSLVMLGGIKEGVRIELPKFGKIEREYDSVESYCIEAHRRLLAGIQSPDSEFFRLRKIDTEIERYFLGIDYGGWAVFPVFDRYGKIYDSVFRDVKNRGGAKYILRRDKARKQSPLYVPDWKIFDSESTCYIVYGILDAISLSMCGLPVVTGTAGKSLSNALLMQFHKKWIIIPDKREETEAYKLAHALGWGSKVKLLKYPEGCKDPDDIRRLFGNDELIRLIKD